jgi:hypothetical protein
MADYDVGAVGLSSPPGSAVLASYRPGILVRNNGIHPALAFGTVRIYKAGLLVFSSEVYSGTIQPGETKPAQAVEYWTPAVVGTYNVQGYVSCNLDQVEPNNNLAPVNIVVGTTPPPPPPIVTPHASQHEEGADDELNVDGLPGKLAERQDPYSHASDHEQGGTDTINVSGLPGLLADAQKPNEHGNEAHLPAFATPAQVADSVGAHNSLPGPHADATNLEKIANRGSANGYCDLNAEAQVPAERISTHNLDAGAHPNSLLSCRHLQHGFAYNTPCNTPLLLCSRTLPGLTGDPPAGTPASYSIDGGLLISSTDTAATLLIALAINRSVFCSLTLPALLPLPAQLSSITFRGLTQALVESPDLVGAASITACLAPFAGGPATSHAIYVAAGVPDIGSDAVLTLTVTLNSPYLHSEIMFASAVLTQLALDGEVLGS